ITIIRLNSIFSACPKINNNPPSPDKKTGGALKMHTSGFPVGLHYLLFYFLLIVDAIFNLPRALVQHSELLLLSLNTIQAGCTG
ncbi:MAG: hypothetical protein PHI32_14750, partial [Dysgonamonadaceae bacterium]|nr:hypothetical protein [Dysgonamonadaceae bacterium]